MMVKSRSKSPFQNYYAEFKDFTLMKADEERALMLVVKSGGPDAAAARDKFTRHNMRLVLSCVLKFCSMEDQRSMDLVSAGSAGLIKAIDDFDVSRANRFSTYAVWWIKAMIRKELHKLNPQVFRYKSLQAAYRSARRELTDDGIPEPSAQMIFELLDWDEVTRNKFLDDLDRRTISLDQPDTDAGESPLESVWLVEDEKYSALTLLMQTETASRLNEALNKLSPELEDIIRRHFALGYKNSETYDNLAAYYNYTRERIRQLENEGLRKLWFLLRDIK
jgi:RNA polymerase sigma factor (sigma-70 family)